MTGIGQRKLADYCRPIVGSPSWYGPLALAKKRGLSQTQDEWRLSEEAFPVGIVVVSSSSSWHPRLGEIGVLSTVINVLTEKLLGSNSSNSSNISGSP